MHRDYNNSARSDDVANSFISDAIRMVYENGNIVDAHVH
jgi:hypothetical protein